MLFPPTATLYPPVKITIRCPDWCDRKEAAIIRSFVSCMHQLTKYSPKLDVSIDKTSDGLRYVMVVAGLEKFTLQSVLSVGDRITKTVQSINIIITEKNVSLSACLLHAVAQKQTGQKRPRETAATTNVNAFKHAREEVN